MDFEELLAGRDEEPFIEYSLESTPHHGHPATSILFADMVTWNAAVDSCGPIANESDCGIVSLVPRHGGVPNLTPAILFDQLSPKPRRKRRVFVPVLKGNNSTGRAGKLRCTECRKVKLKCSYPSDEEPCIRCSQKHFNCIKTWGPKRTDKKQVLQPLPTSSTVAPSFSPVTFVGPFEAGPSIDWCLAYGHSFYARVAQESVHGIFNRMLCSEYGPMLTQNCAVLQSASALHRLSMRPELETPSGQWLAFYHENLSVVHNGLRLAIQTLSVNESHLYALYWILRSCRSCYNPAARLDINAQLTYVEGFLKIMKYLSESTIYIPSPLWHSHLCPWMLGCVIISLSYISPHLTFEPRITDLWWKAHILRTHLWRFETLPGRPHEDMLTRYCLQIIFSLKTCLMVFLAKEHKQEVRRSLLAMREEIISLRQSTQASEVLRAMGNPVYAKIAMQKAPDFLEYLSCVLGRVLLLHPLVEKAVFNRTTVDAVAIAQFVCQFARFSDYLKARWMFLNLVFYAGALFPKAQCLEEKTWVMEQLRDYNPRNSNSEDGINGDPCKHLQKLWASEMNSGDYVEFLLESGL